MKTCIIGGSGFVGSRLIDILKDKSEVINIDKNKSADFNKLTKICDIRKKDLLNDYIKNCDCIVLLAAEHRDDVAPISLYYDVNVEGTKNVLEVMVANGLKKIIFTSSVAIYGLNKKNPTEEHYSDPFNHYGKSKWQAEEILREWYMKDPENRSLTIIRPTVIFGERNRGNVYNLLKQISSGRFLMIGKGENKKSMAYVGNVVAFIDYCIENNGSGYHLYNYIDKPDTNMNELVLHVGKVLNKNIPSIRIPYLLGMLGGYCLDLVAKVTKKKLPISSVRVKKFCATTQFDATKVQSSAFKAPYTLEQGLERTLKFEFVENGSRDGITYKSE